MKKLLILLSLLLIASTSFARILINDKAIMLEPHGDYYSFPDSYQESGASYHFVFVGGVYRVCHLAPQPFLADLDLLKIRIELGEKKFWWYCYAYHPGFFELDF
ncbi:hypothetical protein [Legionella cardiaca]|uniref:Secreted protein n=1 Tax=Legionella cardiaca TaxID=1071983 RepID=A0ABY8AQU7_9GAMM|nr:hypothetical protein [Legionella cardiaca]WED42898.1 hypothetical protein PXX05_13495 [Legionella cardiaca]